LCTPRNICILGPTRVQMSNGISIGSAVFALFTAECLSVLCNALPFPSNLKIAPSHGAFGLHLTHDFLGPSNSSTQTASRWVQPLLQGSLLWQTDIEIDRQDDRPRYLRTKWHFDPSSRLATTDMGQNWGLCPFWERAAGCPSNKMWPGPRPTSVPSFILIHPTVWAVVYRAVVKEQ